MSRIYRVTIGVQMLVEAQGRDDACRAAHRFFLDAANNDPRRIESAEHVFSAGDLDGDEAESLPWGGDGVRTAAEIILATPEEPAEVETRCGSEPCTHPTCPNYDGPEDDEPAAEEPTTHCCVGDMGPASFDDPPSFHDVDCEARRDDRYETAEPERCDHEDQHEIAGGQFECSHCGELNPPDDHAAQHDRVMTPEEANTQSEEGVCGICLGAKCDGEAANKEDRCATRPTEEEGE